MDGGVLNGQWLDITIKAERKLGLFSCTHYFAIQGASGSIRNGVGIRRRKLRPC